MAYGFYYDLDLFSDFTYYLDDPIKGDQFEQQDRRWVAGLDAAHTIFSQWFGRKVENTFGLQVRNDWVHNGLYRTEDRVRTDKNDINACNEEPIPECATNPNLVAVLPAATDLNKFTDTMVGFYVENKTQWAEKFRSVLAMRGDEAIYVVTNLTPSYVASELPGAPVVNFAELNSGTATKFLPSPKASLIFGPWFNTEFYIQGGFSFHSNDVRGATQRMEPISPDYPFPTPHQPNYPPGPNQRRGNRRAHCGRPTSAKYPFALVSTQCFRTAAGRRHRSHGSFSIAEQSLWRRMGELLHTTGTFGFGF